MDQCVTIDGEPSTAIMMLTPAGVRSIGTSPQFVGTSWVVGVWVPVPLQNGLVGGQATVGMSIVGLSA